ncbi:inositol 2-dehydrogenase [Streptomyces sp. DH37]|uniref:inositol 2-dehydrogenase n=1 Tax=Streptomyces sp. DH37 TaxID=3040122 RepID=UPI0024420092|nr:inositol 2-dehydrogenase [Streptomyces sp. DH37]MDG9706208.1 inositol 2-dehydrogenase [Streptomyces sp. DH37]
MLDIALFGSGRIGRVHADTIASGPRTRLSWVCDPLPGAAAELAGRYGAKAAESAGEVLADRSVTAVVIASPTPTHLELIAAAADAGKAVLCEKPIDLDLERVDACWKRIADSGPRVMIGFNRRFDPAFAEIRARIAAGEIGRLEHLVITSRDPEPPPPAYARGAGGIFRDMTIHDLDMARFLLGDIAEVHAMAAPAGAGGATGPEDGEADHAVVTLRSADGRLCQIANSRSCAFGYDQRVEAFGTGGMLQAANRTPTTVRAYTAAGVETASPYLRFFLERYREAYRRELEYFAGAVESGAPLSPGYADGRAALVLAEAACESVRTGRTVAVG